MSTHSNPPLPPFPWLVSSEPGLTERHAASRKTGHDRKLVQLCAGCAAAISVFCGGTSYLLPWAASQPVPAADLAGPTQAAVIAVAPAPAATGVAKSEALTATPAAIMRETAPPAVVRKATSRPPSPAPLIDFSRVAGQPIATDPAPVASPPAPMVSEPPASAATIAEFRSVMEESRDAARLVIRLASRKRPPRDASAAELTGYRLRQQNADAARGYRKYLDSLARSMRGTPSLTVSRELLERAHQTRAYLMTMLADSQASLR